MNRVRIVQRKGYAGKPYYELQYYSMLDNGWRAAYIAERKEGLIRLIPFAYSFSFECSRVYSQRNAEKMIILINDHIPQMTKYIENIP